MLNTRPAQGALHGKAQQHSLHAKLPHLRPVAPKGWLAQAADADSTITATHESSRPANVRVASYEVAEAASAAPPSIASSINPTTLAIAGAVALGAYGIKKIYDTPSRTYNNNVGDEYDSWTQEGILEYYWGEHIHLGYYSEEERKQGYLKKNFKQAKFDFVDEMFNFSESATPTKILDVGCGIGGTSRHLAKKFRGAQVKGEQKQPQVSL
jgi:MPBQ/MSBQ methyltransferase